MARDPRATYAHLINLSNDSGATDSERATARELARQLEERYGPEAVSAEAEPSADVAVSYGHPLEHDLAVRVGRFLGLATLKTGYRRADGKGTRWRDRVTYRGPAGVVAIAVATYTRHRKRLADLLEYTAHGYMLGAFPLPPSERDAGGNNDSEPPAWLTDALLQGHRAGRTNRDRAPAPLLTDGNRR